MALRELLRTPHRSSSPQRPFPHAHHLCWLSGPLHVLTTCLRTSWFLHGSPGSGDSSATVLCLKSLSTTEQLKNSRCTFPKFHPAEEMQSCKTQCSMAGQSRSLPVGVSVSFTMAAIAIIETYSEPDTASYGHLSSLSPCCVLVILYWSEGINIQFPLHTPYHTQGIWDPFLALRKVRKTAWFSKAKPDHHLWILSIKKMRTLHRKSS